MNSYNVDILISILFSNFFGKPDTITKLEFLDPFRCKQCFTFEYFENEGREDFRSILSALVFEIFKSETLFTPKWIQVSLIEIFAKLKISSYNEKIKIGNS